MFSPIIRSQRNSIVLATKAIIETHVVENAIIIVEIIFRKTTTESNKQRKTMLKIYVT